jgi:hypothetical protein
MDNEVSWCGQKQNKSQRQKENYVTFSVFNSLYSVLQYAQIPYGEWKWVAPEGSMFEYANAEDCQGYGG